MPSVASPAAIGHSFASSFYYINGVYDTCVLLTYGVAFLTNSTGTSNSVNTIGFAFCINYFVGPFVPLTSGAAFRFLGDFTC
mmetsp:Transcript_54820/g.138505  ORF Transcript_54820/g.138505 Transcript_54820/m.138505 type:complete len:82 (-) Transcript_54820:247-492(-)